MFVHGGVCVCVFCLCIYEHIWVGVYVFACVCVSFRQRSLEQLEERHSTLRKELVSVKEALSQVTLQKEVLEDEKGSLTQALSKVGLRPASHERPNPPGLALTIHADTSNGSQFPLFINHDSRKLFPLLCFCYTLYVINWDHNPVSMDGFGHCCRFPFTFVETHCLPT